MSDPNEPVSCEVHGEGHATFMCIHLACGVACGYHASEDDPADPRPDAWCSACDSMLGPEGDWTEEAIEFADVTLCCPACYDENRARNETPAGPLHGRGRLTPEEWADFLHQAVHACQARQEAADAKWGFGAYAHWERDGTAFRFTDPDRPTLACTAIVVGSWSSRTSTWMWSWANESNDPEETEGIESLSWFGLARGVEPLEDAHWEADEQAGWEMAAVASELLGAEAVYRAPMGHLSVFLLLRDFRFRLPL